MYFLFHTFSWCKKERKEKTNKRKTAISDKLRLKQTKNKKIINMLFTLYGVRARARTNRKKK
jgi:hypothetical protein